MPQVIDISAEINRKKQQPMLKPFAFHERDLEVGESRATELSEILLEIDTNGGTCDASSRSALERLVHSLAEDHEALRRAEASLFHAAQAFEYAERNGRGLFNNLDRFLLDLQARMEEAAKRHGVAPNSMVAMREVVKGWRTLVEWSRESAEMGLRVTVEGVPDAE